MENNLKRFTISVTSSMESELDLAKRDRYYKETWNDMIKDLISRGLTSLKNESNVIKVKQPNKLLEQS